MQMSKNICEFLSLSKHPNHPDPQIEDALKRQCKAGACGLPLALPIRKQNF